MLPGQEHGIGQQRRRQFHDVVALFEMTAKMSQYCPRLCRSKAATALPTRDGRIGLDGRNTCQEDRVNGLHMGQGPDPGTAYLSDVTLDESARVEEINCHLNDARG